MEDGNLREMQFGNVLESTRQLSADAAEVFNKESLRLCLCVTFPLPPPIIHSERATACHRLQIPHLPEHSLLFLTLSSFSSEFFFFFSCFSDSGDIFPKPDLCLETLCMCPHLSNPMEEHTCGTRKSRHTLFAWSQAPQRSWSPAQSRGSGEFSALPVSAALLICSQLMTDLH